MMMSIPLSAHSEKKLSKTTKNPAAVALGRKGGIARAKSISSEMASLIGKNAVAAREKKRKAKLSACLCGKPVERLLGNTWKCYECAKITVMRASAKVNGKLCPSVDEIRAMLRKCEAEEMRCPHCRREMVLNQKQKDKKSVVSLQHWDDGTVSMICFSCNARHGGMRGMRDEKLKNGPTLADLRKYKPGKAGRPKNG